MNIKRCFFTFFLSLCCCLGFLLPFNSVSAAAPTENHSINVRYPDPEKLRDFQNDRDFQYEQDVKPAFTFWERFLQRIRKILSDLLAGQSYQHFWKYVLYAFATGVTVFVVLKLLQVDFTGLFGRQPVKNKLTYDTFEENIHEMDFQALIEEAVQQKDFRKAIRLSYLSTLKNLTDRELINWSPGKTNRSYVTELRNPGMRHRFEHITGTFEYVWYGGTALTENNFVTTRQAFQEFNLQIRQQG
jgi:hypothetical protein